MLQLLPQPAMLDILDQLHLLVCPGVSLHNRNSHCISQLLDPAHHDFWVFSLILEDMEVSLTTLLVGSRLLRSEKLKIKSSLTAGRQVRLMVWYGASLGWALQ